MNKKALIFVSSLFMASFVLLFFSKPFVFSYDVRIIVPVLVAMIVAQYIEIPIGGIRFTAKPFLYIFLIPFISPETILVLSLITSTINKNVSWDRKLLRLSFEFLQISVGTFLFKRSVFDYLSLIYFAIGFFATNVLLSFVYVYFFTRTKLKNYIIVALIVFVLGLYASLIVTTIYLLPEVKFSYLVFTLLLYAGFLVQLYYTVTAQVWYQQLKYEQDEIRREIENLSKIPDVLEKIGSEDVDRIMNDLLEVECKLIGFSAALLNLFDYKSGRVIRVSKYGIKDEDFEMLRSKQPQIKDTLLLMQSRFDLGGVYFIPKGSIALDQTYIFKPSDYAALDADNAWDPDDLFLVPLVSNNRTVGYISFDKPVNGLRPTKREIELSKFFAWQFVQIVKESKYKSLFAGHYAEESTVSEFVEEMVRAIETKRTFSFIHLDIDNFGRINLEKGFTIGDEILREIKNAIEDEIKNYGLYTRTGDEFMVLLWTKSKSDAMILVQKVIENIKEKYPFVSITGAVVKYPVDAVNLEEILNKAKMALVAGKKSGGGRIINI
ncbi:diguanylate cyclase (GGDEF) domain-containing protein [Fervidobacterium changbaicum]|uniref:GGDEF domain-containing protein n=1 Tax=Fervidobacterium changbaicum TaxID=310769 RepID=A0ABX5QPN3_9BACT|nr:GGDEF domain-containing protein [Fervidobacterium changbaicum]QAV32349.1 GGDEF domain-containing protein [Fervidobacterium changbaicum]SDH21715.1 diguanylate cyclase (GGDEF) domain-containing protein [Fervidobacterium changbaicum]